MGHSGQSVELAMAMEYLPVAQTEQSETDAPAVVGLNVPELQLVGSMDWMGQKFPLGQTVHSV